MPYRKFALKLLQKRQLERFRTPDGSTGLIKLQNEVNIMRTIFHPNVIILFEAIWECCDSNSGDDEIQIALITQGSEGKILFPYGHGTPTEIELLNFTLYNVKLYLSTCCYVPKTSCSLDPSLKCELH